MAEEFHLAIGGPFYRLRRAAGIDSIARMLPLLIGATWIPLMTFTLVQWASGGHVEPLVRDLSVHTRLLVALPLFVVSERVLDYTAMVALRQLFDEGFITPESTERVRALLRGVQRWRDATLPESILLAIAVGVGVAALVGILPPAGSIHGIVDSRPGVVRIWYGLVSLPLFQFFLWRSLYRWALWVRVLVGLARVPLRLLPAHADRHGGIGFVKMPIIAYCSLMLLALNSVLCAGWGTQVLIYNASLKTFKSLFVSYVLIGVVVAFAPLLVLVPQLFKARILGRRQYGDLVSDYTQRFHEHWIERPDRPGLLGTPHISSLSDLGTSYRESIEQMRVLLFTAHDWMVLLSAAFIPAIPLLFLQMPAHEVIKRLVQLLVGRMPH